MRWRDERRRAPPHRRRHARGDHRLVGVRRPAHSLSVSYATELYLIVARHRTLRATLGELALLEAREIVLVAAAR